MVYVASFSPHELGRNRWFTFIKTLLSAAELRVLLSKHSQVRQQVISNLFFIFLPFTAFFHFDPTRLDAAVKNVSASCSSHLLNVWKYNRVRGRYNCVRARKHFLQGSGADWSVSPDAFINYHQVDNERKYSISTDLFHLESSRVLIKYNFHCCSYPSVTDSQVD